MKKITSLLMLFCAFVGTAFAEGLFKASQAPVEGKWDENATWYYIQFPNSDLYHSGGYLGGFGNGYIDNNGFDNNISRGKLLIRETEKPINYSGLWCLVGDEATGYKFYNRMSPYLILGLDAQNKARLYLDGETYNNVTFSFASEASTNTKEGLENCVTFKIPNTNKYWNNTDSGNENDYLSVWDNAGAVSDNGSAIRLIEVTNEELAQMALEMPVADKKYTIKNARSGKYASYTGDGTRIKQVENALTNNEIWSFEVVDDGYKLCNQATTKKFAATNSFTNDGVKLFVKENPYLAGYVCLSTTSDLSSNCWDDASSHTEVNTWNPRKTDYEGTSWIIEEVAPIEVTFNYYDGETLITTNTSNVIWGATIEPSMAPAIDYFVNSSFKVPGEYIAGDVTSVDIACEPNFPFTAMTITDGQFTSDKFYMLTINNQGTRPVVYKNEGNSPVHTKVGTQALAKENLWAFERVAGKPYVVRLYNMAAGATSSLKAKSQDDVAVTFAATDRYTDEFIVRKNGNNFVLICNVDGGRDLNACINVDGTNNGLGVWGDEHNDPGSTFVIAPASDLVDDYAFVAPSGIDENYASDEYVKYVDNRTSEFLAKVVAYNENKNYATLVDVLDNLPETAPTSGNTISADKFYQLISYNDANCKGKAVYSISGCDKNGGKSVYFDRQILIETEVGGRPVAETAFQFITVDGGYKIAHANSDYYFAFMSAFGDMGNPDLPINTYGTMVIEPQRNFSNVWSIRGNDNTEKYFHCGKGTNQTIVRQQSPATNDGNLWLIKEITKIPVKVGAAKWSTLCLPMAVVVPEDATLKVFYATGVDAEGNLELEEVAAGTVVAKKQAMLIYSTSENESDTYNFAVSTEAGTTFEGSILSGSTARRGNFSTTDSEYYALANHEGVVGFYPSLSAKIAANKAYILNSALPQPTNALRLSFGSTTGIDAVEGNVNATKTVYYDLNGRVVLYPTNGIYVTNTGKKVFIK